MSEHDVVLPEALGRLAEARGTGQAANGLVRLVVDGTGDLVELVIEPRAMRLASVDLAAAVREAFHAARDAAREALAASAPTPSAQVEQLGAAGATLAQLGLDAQRRLDEMTSVVRDLSTRLDRLG